MTIKTQIMATRVQRLIAAAPRELAGPLIASPGLEEELAAALAAARATWPEIDLSDDDFLRHVAERAAIDEQGHAKLPLRLAEDLFLACACAKGNEVAIHAFQARYQPNYRAVFTRMGLTAVSDDLAQALMCRLFVVSGDRPPAIEGFSGRGALGKWIKVLAAREGHRFLERDQARSKRSVQRDVEQISEAMGKADPELDRLKDGYRRHFKMAFKAAFSELPERGRNLFRLQYIDGLSLDKMAAVYNVSRATVARWRTRARQDLLQLTRAHLVGALGATHEEVDSIMRFIDSELDVSLTRLLREQR